MFHDDYVNYIGNKFDLPYSGLREKFDNLNKSKQLKASYQQQPTTAEQTKPAIRSVSKSNSISKSKEIPPQIAINVLLLLLHNRQTLETEKIIPDRLDAFLFPKGALRDIYESLVESNSLNEAIDKLKGTDSQLSTVALLRASKPIESPSTETAKKMVGELLIRTVEKQYESLHERAVVNGDLASISDLGKVHTNKSIMQNEGYDLFSPEADFLIDWLRERLATMDSNSEKPKHGH
jgi:hypothetical protein